MATRKPKLTGGRAVGSKIVGHKFVRNKGHLLEQCPQQFQCRPLVPLTLDNNVEDFAFGVHGLAVTAALGTAAVLGRKRQLQMR